jgi:transcriptional regulator with XRE-family HTH domain
MKRGRPKGKSSDKRSFGPLGDLIRKRRLERGLGLADVAKAVKCSVQFISNIEHGRAPLPWDKAERLSTYLEIPMDELQAANLQIRADFKSFLATSAKGKRVAKASTALANVKDAATVVAASTQDPTLSDIIRLYQAAAPANRKKLYAAAKELLETL